MKTVSVMIPTLNEESSIGKAIYGVPVAELVKNRFKTTVYVIDGHSTDGTLENAASKGSVVRAAFEVVDADHVIKSDIPNLKLFLNNNNIDNL